MSKYTATIGIECHVQLKTKTKLFSAVDNDASQAAPNTLISHIDLGLPGALPVLNEKALELAVRAAFALNTKPQTFSKFDRKHYFYPDLPKGYQITQYEDPIIKGGHVDIAVDGQAVKIGITRVHLEEDAGKNTHPAGADYSLVDLNRAGTPLLEIVSEPDIRSAAQAKAYVRELYLLMKYANVSDCDLYLGHMRFDVNTSVSKDDKKGTRSEVKNLNSFKSVEAAVKYEIKRQTELLEKGEAVVQETRGWDEAKQKTVSQRGKEEAHDYRYMPEPDIPPIELTNSDIAGFQIDMPELPSTIRQQLAQIDIDQKVVEDILGSPEATHTVLEVVKLAEAEDARRVALWFVHAADKLVESRDHMAGKLIPVEQFIKLSEMVGQNKLSSSAGKEVFWEMLKTGEEAKALVEKMNLSQISDEGEIEKIVAEVIAENPKAAEDVKAGEAKATMFLVGQVMAKSKGQANPTVAAGIIKRQLGV